MLKYSLLFVQIPQKSAEKINENYYIDGGFTNNLPNLYPGQSIRIQPFSTLPENAEISSLLSYPDDAKATIIQKCPNQNFTMYLKERNLNRAFVKELGFL